MVEFNIEDTDEGEWFPYQDSHLNQDTGEWVFDEPISDAKVRIRSIQKFLSERFRNRKKVAEHILNPKTRSMERITYYKDSTSEELKKEADDTWDYIITGIEGFKNKKTGGLIECTRENKIKLMSISSFDRFIGKCLKVLEGSEEKQKEETEKN